MNMDENKEINKNEQNPNSNSKNNKRYKYKNRRKKLADSLQNENDTPKIDQNSNKENSENSENKTEKKKKKNRNLPSKLTGNEDWQIALAECIEANRVSHENRLHPLKYNNSSEH
ncbi:TPA: ribonuclease J, partial [Campylobacter jejuni]|nr:ribonuclease J [Campylobacter jejuni]